jgi:hypothetical protein
MCRYGQTLMRLIRRLENNVAPHLMDTAVLPTSAEDVS